uniref:Glycosyltransferase family 92 protein n=1 Tax=Heterorhabditis bacteriophora TaxID=37862 RepID=A0A1I7WP93_HETBA
MDYRIVIFLTKEIILRRIIRIRSRSLRIELQSIVHLVHSCALDAICYYATVVSFTIESGIKYYTKLVILLDINHLYNIDGDTYLNLQITQRNYLPLHESLKSIFRFHEEEWIQVCKMCLNFSFSFFLITGKSYIFRGLWNYRVIVFSTFPDNGSTLFWPSYTILSPWPNTNRLLPMLEYLKNGLDINMDVFYVTQGVLTAEMKDVVSHLYLSIPYTYI